MTQKRTSGQCREYAGSPEGRYTSQARYLTGLCAAKALSARELSRRSTVVAEELGKPEFAVSHQAVSTWLNGTRHPSANHKETLATVLGVSVTELSAGCDLQSEPADPKFESRPATVEVPGLLQTYRYCLDLRNDIDLNLPAIYPDWSSMFSFPPTPLKRHLRNVNCDSFGWIPNHSASPMIHYAHCLVPLTRVSERDGLRSLDLAESSQRRVWFVHLPDGQLHVGMGYRNNRSFVFARNMGNKVVVSELPLRRVDLIGFFSGNVVFHLLPMSTEPAAKVHEKKGEVAGYPGRLHNSKMEYMSKNVAV